MVFAMNSDINMVYRAVVVDFDRVRGSSAITGALKTDDSHSAPTLIRAQSGIRVGSEMTDFSNGAHDGKSVPGETPVIYAVTTWHE